MLRISPEQAEKLRKAVQTAHSHPDLAQKLAGIYQEIQQSIDDRKPRCDVSGRCCRFDEYGHKLFVTTLELAAFIQQVGQFHPQSLPITPGLCPYQQQKLCTVHPIRPFGCRIYFCDPTAQDWQQEQYEIFHLKIKQLHDELGVEYFYVEWLEGLTVTQSSSDEKQRSRFRLTRDSVCAGDDADAPHEKTVEIVPSLDPITFARDLSTGYLASVAGIGHSWTCELNGTKVAVISHDAIRSLVSELPLREENEVHFHYHSATY